MNEAINLMPRLMEVGLLNGHPLLMLQRKLAHVCEIKKHPLTIRQKCFNNSRKTVKS